MNPMTEGEVVDHVVAALKRGEGGRIVTPNIDICRAASRDPEIRALVENADLAVADGMPLVWAAPAARHPAAGPDHRGRPDLVAVGGRGVLPLPDLPARRPAGRAGAGRLRARRPLPRADRQRLAQPAVRVRGRCRARSRRSGRRWSRANPRIVFVGLGFPRQERLIARLREELPGAWFVGCGSAIAFAAGAVPRAPRWMQQAGLEWLFRLASEPGRLARRYLVDDLPYALRLLTVCALKRLFS